MIWTRLKNVKLHCVLLLLRHSEKIMRKVNVLLDVLGLDFVPAPIYTTSIINFINDMQKLHYFVTSSKTDSSADSDTRALRLYSNEFAQMCTAGPKGTYKKIISYNSNSIGLAVYFYLESSYGDCGSGEDNAEFEDILTWDQPPRSPNQSTHFLSLVWSFAKYLFFGAFVMILSHIHHHNRLKRIISVSNGNVNLVGI